MMRFILLLLLLSPTVGCSEEAKPTTQVPPIGDRFDKGKDLKGKDLKGKKPNPTIGQLPGDRTEPLAGSGDPWRSAAPTQRCA